MKIARLGPKQAERLFAIADYWDHCFHLLTYGWLVDQGPVCTPTRAELDAHCTCQAQDLIETKRNLLCASGEEGWPVVVRYARHADCLTCVLRGRNNEDTLVVLSELGLATVQKPKAQRDMVARQKRNGSRGVR